MEKIEIHRHAVNDKFFMLKYLRKQIISAIKEINSKKYVEIAIRIAHQSR